MYQLKQKPEDFLVKEISSFQPQKTGSYAYFKLTKKNWNTLDAVKEISKRLHLPLKNIGFAGSKDKHALTEQLISIKNIKKEKTKKLEQLNIKDLTLKFLGYAHQPLTLGDLAGNYFEITIRNLEKEELENLLKVLKGKKKKKMLNYFDQQRFGTNNIEIGRSLIKKDFSHACQLLGLEVKRNDYLGALKTLPKRLLRLYVNAYQSYLWNKLLQRIIAQKIKIKLDTLPLIGFATGLSSLPSPIRKLIEEFLKEENLSLNDFLIKQIPELSLEGEPRKVWVEAKEINFLEVSEDELNLGKKKLKLSFILPKGSYATLFIKSLFPSFKKNLYT